VIVCDTHAMIFDALAPDRLGPDAAKSIEESHRSGELACADISLWEIAMLVEKGRLQVNASIEDFITAMITARDITVLPITPAIAAVAALDRGHGHRFRRNPDHQGPAPCRDTGVAGNLVGKMTPGVPQVQPVIWEASRERVRTQATEMATSSEP